MNREIKFRFYDTSNKVFYFWGFGMHSDEPNDFFVNPGNSKHVRIQEQFSGLTDKNGKEIYEGDILSDGHKYLTVSYKTVNGAFWATNEKYRIYAHKFKIFGIIGNIHETPELLNNGQ